MQFKPMSFKGQLYIIISLFACLCRSKRKAYIFTAICSVPNIVMQLVYDICFGDRHHYLMSLFNKWMNDDENVRNITNMVYLSPHCFLHYLIANLCKVFSMSDKLIRKEVRSKM